MNVESWITVEETPALAAQATALIDARLARLTDAERDAFWASIRKAYNTPYNDPAKPAQPKPVEPAPGAAPTAVEIHLPEIDPAIDLPAAALAAAALTAEMRAA
ncbi:hypothetical protein H0176_08965 [Methylorubrum populi]|jgi:hypothetical protein|uniref:hypothetical protein n=1 Tax=Methylorubrum rhodesianum TaxID=29427 RepID=UPI0003494B8F|nr:hypothetical protein [Methylorubrum rhodesianum]MBK3404719.1 hypothetical protein [Methylorubrum rhodesianum]MBY0140399.1 hypothetical protein [Methylorubrum populi]MRI53028.1 hypothetical protein [Methylobacterium sp. DB1607]